MHKLKVLLKNKELLEEFLNLVENKWDLKEFKGDQKFIDKFLMYFFLLVNLLYKGKYYLFIFIFMVIFILLLFLLLLIIIDILTIYIIII